MDEFISGFGFRVYCVSFMTSLVQMDEYLAVRFHMGGIFARDGRELRYCGGRTGMSYIENDKMSLPEVKGYL